MGGKVDKAESLKGGAIREIFEETGFRLNKNELYGQRTVYVVNDGLEYVHHMFRACIQSPDVPCIRKDEHKDFIWVSLKDSLNMELIPGQKTCIQLMFNETI